jgi:Putative prokaryotic signal transducing protein
VADRLTKVALAANAFEGAMIKGLLEDAGIPAFLQQSVARVDGTELAFGMLARRSMGGPQDVMVEDARAEEAAAILAAPLAEGDEEGG